MGLLEDKTIGWYFFNAGQHQLGFNICCVPCQLLLCCGLRRISSGTNLAPESLRTVCASGTLQDAQVTVAHCPVTNKVDCCEEFYSFTNQAFVLWRFERICPSGGSICQTWSSLRVDVRSFSVKWSFRNGRVLQESSV